MSVRCLITDGKNYEQNKQFVEDTLKYFPDYDFNIMKATISGWQSSQLKDNEDRLPTIQELINYLQDSAKRENNNNIKIIADKAQQILNNLSTYEKELQDILAKAPRDSQGRLLAPNGKPSNLTERQYAQVRTKEFKKWFGDWEKEYTPPIQYDLSTWERTGKYVDVLEKDFLGNNYSASKEILSHPIERKEPTKEDPFGFNSAGVSKAIKIGTLVNRSNPLNGICQFTAQRIQAFLKDRYGINTYINIISAKSPVTGKLITHYVVVLSIDGKPYIYDMPQTEFITTNGNTFNVGNKEYKEAVITKEYTPRLIPITKESLLKNYGDSNDIQISVIENTAKLSDNIKSSDIETSYIPAYSPDVSKVVDENGEPLVVYHGTKSLEEFSEFDKDTAIYTTDELLMGVSYVPDELYEYVEKLTEGSSTKEVLDVLYYYTSQLKKGEPFDYLNSNYTALKETLEPLGITVEEKSTYTLEDLEKYKNLVKAANIPIKLARGVDAFVKPLFGKIKNPLIIDAKGAMWNKISFNGKIYSTRELEQLYRNTEYDGIIIKNVLDYGGAGSLPSTVYIQYNPNQIKSATDNTGAFSSTNDDIYDSQMQQQQSQTKFSTSKSNLYPERTKENADWSDITLALATDFNTAGEKLTKRVAGDKYIHSPLPDDGHDYLPYDNRAAYEFYAKQIYEELKKKGKISNIKLNIAGNGIYSLKGFATQGELNDYVTNLLKSLQSLGITISEIRSGGQTGVDEAGIIAAQRLGIPNEVHATSDYKFRDKSGEDVSDEWAFKARFQQQSYVQQQEEIDPLKISNKTQAFGVTIDSNLIRNYRNWLQNNPNGIVAYRVNRQAFNTPQMVEQGIIGNPFDWQKYGTEVCLKMFYDWLVNGNNYNEPLATKEFRQAIINKLLNTQTPNILYYKELNMPSHATVLGYLITNKQLISPTQQPQTQLHTIKESVGYKRMNVVLQDLINKIDESGIKSAKAARNLYDWTIQANNAILDAINKGEREDELIDLDNFLDTLNRIASHTPKELGEKAIKAIKEFSKDFGIQQQTQSQTQQIQSESQPITTEQLNEPQQFNEEKIKATRDFLNPVTRKQVVQKIARMFSNIVSKEYDNQKQALDNRIANETDDKVKKELLFQRRKFNRYQVIKTMTPVAIFNKLKETYEKYVSLTDEQGKNLEKTILNKNSVFQKMPDAQKDRIAQMRFNNKKKAYQLILDNFKILAMEASKSFALTEGVNLTFNTNMVTQLQEQDTYDDEGNSNISGNKEEKSKEHWMIDIRTVSSFNSLTNKIRQAINNIARVTKDGIQEVDDMGDTIYLSGSYVHSELIKTLAAEITDPNDIIPILQKAAVRKPWINQIIYKIQEDPILFTEMYRAYNKSTLNYWIQKPRTQQDGSIKTQTISLNKMEGMDQLFETWRDNYEYGNKLEDDAIYTSDGTIIKDNVKKGLDLVNEVKSDIYYHRKDTRETRVAVVLNKDNVLKLTKAFKMLGLPLEEQTVAEAIGYNIDNTQYEPDFNTNTLVNALVTIYDDLLKNKEVKEGEQFDMANAYGRALENVAKVISFVTEDTMESQVRHNKKSLYAHVNSGYMINLIKKLKNPDKFKDFIEKEYMPVEWFYKNGQWRNQFIKNLYNNQEDRDKLQHIVMLDYNGKEYADWSTLDSTLVLINQFFSQPTKDEHGWAYYNIPVLSDTESAEFLRMRRYISNFEDIINTKFINLVKQEIDRIDLVKRRANDPNVEKITNFDMVKTVDKNGNEHIKYGGAEFKFFPELNFIQVNGKSFLDEYYRLSQTETTEKVNQFIKEQISFILERRFKTALQNWDKIGLFERVDDNPNSKFKYFDTNSRTTAEQLLKQWYWNSSFAQSQIIELLTTDLAFYKTKGKDFLTDFIKRAKEFHAPIERLNTEAEWIVNGERKKVCYDDNGNKLKNRVLYLKDCEVPSLTLEELKEALDKNPKLTKEEKGIIIGAYQNINMADAQAYRTLDSFRRTQIMAGQWSDDEETAYNNIKNGNFRLEDITVLWNTRKPYLYTQTNQSNQVDNSNIRVPVQHKNSEMIMLTQAILGTIMSTGKLAALERFMTKNNIDVVMFESAVKAGGQDIIDLNNIEASEVEDYLADYVNTYSQAIHEFDYEDYGIQTATPEHGIDAMQLVGTQIRRIIASNQDMTDPNFRFKYKDKEWTVQEWQDYYNMVNTANIKESFQQLDKKFSNIKEIEKLLLSEVRSNPRYDTDIEIALTLNSDGVFNIPLLDPSITYKIQSLLTSIVKNRITKQKIAGGAFIQTSAWGFKREPKVIYNEDGSVKYIECYMPCPSEELYNMLLDDKTHEVDINKKYKGKDGKWHYIVPEKYRELIGYRVPTESFYSCAPLKVIGYLPRQCGTIMVVPRDIVSMAGSDFDKLYVEVKPL